MSNLIAIADLPEILAGLYQNPDPKITVEKSKRVWAKDVVNGFRKNEMLLKDAIGKKIDYSDNEVGTGYIDADSVGAWLAALAFDRSVFDKVMKDAAPVTKAGTNKKEWDDARKKSLWEESIMPGVTKTGLGKKYGISRQRIGVLIAEAKDSHTPKNISPFSLAVQLINANKGKKY